MRPTLRQHGPRHRRGITLVDTVMVIVVLGVAIPPLMALMAAGAQGASGPEARIVATCLARDEIEQIMAQRHDQGYDALSVSTTNESAGSIAGYPGFARSTQITEDGTKQWKSVTVTVTWNGGGVDQVDVRAAIVFTKFQ